LAVVNSRTILIAHRFQVAKMKSEKPHPTQGASGEASSLDTVAIHGNRRPPLHAALAPPIYQTSSFRALSNEEFARLAVEPRNDHFYTRCGNPTLSETEAVIADLEGGESALLTGSGMAAITTAVLTFVESGDHVVAQRNHYAGTTSLVRDFLPRYGVEVSVVDQTDVAAFENALKPNSKLLVLETPSNPLMILTDLTKLCAIAKQRGLLTIVDNTFATPINQRPLLFGADLVVHSGTKYLGGHSDVSAGAIVGSSSLLAKVWEAFLLLGPVLGPIDAWLLLRGLRTLPVRIERQNRSALAISEFLAGHPKVERVNYPGLDSHPQRDLARSQMSGFTGILSFVLKGKDDAAQRLIAGLRLIAHASSFGGVESLVVSPTIMESHLMSKEQFALAGVRPSLLRLSVGLENKQDLIADLEQALEEV
jgi:cystathionine beta-lyase/cystathionine gamma-synthase